MTDRWDRLAADLDAAGIPARVDRKPYVQERYGRIEHGTSCSITLRHADGGLVEVSDKYGRGGKWYGWTVCRSGPDSITIGRPTWAVTKRSEIVAAVRVRMEST